MNKDIDRNNNGVPDHIETTVNYIIGGFIIALVALMKIRYGLSEGAFLKGIGLALAVTGGRTIVKDFLGK